MKPKSEVGLVKTRPMTRDQLVWDKGLSSMVLALGNGGLRCNYYLDQVQWTTPNPTVANTPHYPLYFTNSLLRVIHRAYAPRFSPVHLDLVHPIISLGNLRVRNQINEAKKSAVQMGVSYVLAWNDSKRSCSREEMVQFLRIRNLKFNPVGPMGSKGLVTMLTVGSLVAQLSKHPEAVHPSVCTDL